MSSSQAGAAGGAGAGVGRGPDRAGAGAAGTAGASARAGSGAAGRRSTAGPNAAGSSGRAEAGTAARASTNASAGTNPSAGNASAGTAAADGGNTRTCNRAFIAAGKCDPEIQFRNDAADGDGAIFAEVMPDPVATLATIACQVCTILYRDPAEITREPSMIRLRIYDFEGVANAGGENINLSSRHVANYDDPEDALFEFIGVLLHETTHLYQFDGGGGALVEGMADFVRIRAGHHRMNRRTRGGAWTDPYTTSGFFFSWLAGPGGLQTDGYPKADPDIGWAINQAMRNNNFNEQVFAQRLGKNVDALWQDYQDAL